MGIGDRVRSFFARSSTNLASVPTTTSNGWQQIREAFSGAWQRNITQLKDRDIRTYSTVYACMARISSDIGKLPFQFKRIDEQGLWRDGVHPTVSALLRRPNSYQTPAQFREAWILSKLQAGNVYVLKGRGSDRAVTDLWVLDPARVQPKIADSGDVYYELSYGSPNNLLPMQFGGETITVPATEIIHDREMAIYHQLVGVSPLAAAYLAAVKNVRIQNSAAEFFANDAQPSGLLTAPAGMTEEDAQDVKTFWETNYSGQNRGRVAVIGADMKYTPFAFNASDSQMVEQLRYSDEQVCHAFGIPPFKVGIGSIPAGMKVDDLNQMYYADALQARIEAMEDCLDRGLRLDETMGVELNLEPLLRMDAQKMATVEGELVSKGIKAPNEARRRFGLAPLTGGDSVYLQQQNYSMEALAKRDSSPDPFGKGASESQRHASPRLTRDMATAPKRRARYNHDGTWDIELDPGNWLRGVKRAV